MDSPGKVAMEIQGHRGARASRPENTLPSFEAALDICVGSIETDIHRTSDGNLVLHHDANISDRICTLLPGRAAPAPSTAAAIEMLDLVQIRSYEACLNPDRSRFPRQEPLAAPTATAFAHEAGILVYGIPTLSDLFEFVKSYAGELGRRSGKTDAQRFAASQLILDLEIKSVPFTSPAGSPHSSRVSPALVAARTVELIRQAAMVSRCRIRSFDHRIVRLAGELEPGLESAILVADNAPIRPEELARSAGARWYCPDYRFLDHDLVQACHAAGVLVMPWTVNSPFEWEVLSAWGVDGITTDDPHGLSDWLGTRRLAAG